MSGQMNAFLAEAYGTQTQQPTQDAEKVAQAELFAKLAAEQGIDLEKLSEAEVVELWNTVFAKTAGEGEHGHKDEKHGHKEAGAKTAGEHGHSHKEEHAEKKAEAEALQEWLQTKEAQAQWQQADFTGRQMAHAYVAELRKIASEGGLDFLNKEAGDETTKEAKGLPPWLKHAPEKVVGKAGRALQRVGEKVTEHAPEKAKDVLRKHVGDKETLKKVHKGVGAAAVGTGAAATAAGAYGAHKAMKKKASALTETSAILAVEKAAAAGWDREEAIDRLSAVLTLGFNEENTKVAAADEFPQAKEIRALELLEVAGYPVTWPGAEQQ